MKTARFLSIGAALLLTLPAIASPRHGGSLLHPSSGSSSSGGASSGAYTPPVGSPTRAAIADAMRRKVGQSSGKYVVFVIQHLKIEDGWAWCVARPQSAGGHTTYNTVGTLLHQIGGRWNVVRAVDGRAVANAPSRLLSQFPDAPESIFH